MNCSQVEKLLLEDLDASFEGEVSEHLEQCASCSRLLNQLQDLETLKGTLARASAAPTDFQGRVVGQVTRERYRPWVALAGILVLVVGAGWMNSSGSGSLFDSSPSLPEAAAGAAPGMEAGLLTGKPTPADDQYLEILLKQPLGEPVIVRIPATIEVRQAGLDREFLTRVSH